MDRNGEELTAAQYPSLAGILGQLQARYGTKMRGTPGTEIRVKNAGGSAGRVLRVLAQGMAGKPLPTTIDAKLQAEAEKDVRKQGPDASVVAVRPSTGDVLAVAMTPAKGFDKAFQGTYAPGSTFKVITASTLLESGKLTPSTPLNCPQYFSYGGLTFHNVDKMKIDHADLAMDFEASCNTAFMSTVQVLPDGAVESEARDVFGLGLNWKPGVQLRRECAGDRRCVEGDDVHRTGQGPRQPARHGVGGRHCQGRRVPPAGDRASTHGQPADRPRAPADERLGRRGPAPADEVDGTAGHRGADHRRPERRCRWRGPARPRWTDGKGAALTPALLPGV